jgi:hypothetical protein
MEKRLILDGVDDDLGEKFICRVASSTPRASSRRRGGNSTATGFRN